MPAVRRRTVWSLVWARRPAAARFLSFDGLRGKDLLQTVHVVTAREREEALVVRGAVRDIPFKNALDDFRRIPRLHVVEDLASEPRLWTEAAANENVITLDRIAIFGHLHLGREQADVADVVLRAGMMTAGQVDIDRPVEFDAFLAPARNILGVALRVGGCELATDIAGAGDKAGTDGRRFGREAEGGDRGFGERDLVGRHP